VINNASIQEEKRKKVCFMSNNNNGGGLGFFGMVGAILLALFIFAFIG